MASISSLKTLKTTTLFFCPLVLQLSLIKGQGPQGGNDQSSSDQVNLHSSLSKKKKKKKGKFALKAVGTC